MPYADVVSFTTHKVLRGPRSGAIVCKEEHATKIDKAVFPMMQGGPQMHTIAAKAVNFKECATPEYAEYAKQVIANARQLAATLGERGIRPTTGGTDTHLSLHDLQGVGVTGKEAEERSDAAGHRAQQERHPLRPAEAQHRLRHPRRHPLRDDPGHGHRGDEGDRPTLIAKAVTEGDADPDHAVSKEVRAQVTELVTRFPAYPR